MAIIFELWVECADAAAHAALMRHFEGLEFELTTGKQVRWKFGTWPVEGSHPLVLSSPDLSEMGVRTVTDAIELSESGMRLLAHLRDGPDFRFARVALEAELIPMQNLAEYMDRIGDRSHFTIECVVDDALYRELGEPQFCKPFRPGYWWTGYRGERYQPIYSNDQPELFALHRRLFPGDFNIPDKPA